MPIQRLAVSLLSLASILGVSGRDLSAGCAPYGDWQPAIAAPGIAGTPLFPTDVLGVPAILFAGDHPASDVPFFLWDGTATFPLAAGPDRVIIAAEEAVPFETSSGPVIAVRGAFQIAGVATALAIWDGVDWQLPGAAVNGVLHSIAVHPSPSGPELWIGGEVGAVGGVLIANGVARWRGGSWDVPADVVGVVTAIAVAAESSGPVIYLAGYIVQIDGVPVANLARYDGATWDPMDGGTIGEVAAISVVETSAEPELWIGGDFSEVGGVSALHIARWRGGAWEQVPPMPFPVPFAAMEETRFLTVPTEYGSRIAPLDLAPSSSGGGFGWNEVTSAWEPLGADPTGAVPFAGSSLLAAGIHRTGATAPGFDRWCFGPEFPFARGDSNDDGTIDIADAIHHLGILFAGADAGGCLPRHDANDDGLVNIADSIMILFSLFPSPSSPPSAIPPPNLPNCGMDPFSSTIYCTEPSNGC